MKTCPSCNIKKSFNEFSKNKKRKDGLQSYCKCCKKKYWKENIDRLKEYHKQYRQENKDIVSERIQKWRNENKGYQVYYYKKRRKQDHLFKLSGNLRNRICRVFKDKRWDKNSKTQEILGADWILVKKHMESRFKKGMSWDNHGEWHIDHIIPLASAKTEEELIKLCHYTNLQPLWAEDNLKKGSKIIACKL